MDELKWNERFNIGVEIVDQAHEKLFSIVEGLLAFDEDEKRRQWACSEGIKFFKSYALRHFAEEEAYMLSINYSGYAVHKRLHDDMRDKTLVALEKDLEDSGYSSESIQHFLGICIGWLTGHILIEDRAITGKIKTRWSGEGMGEELQQLENGISDVMQEAFKLKTQLVSEHYIGEDFGNAIIYRLTYLSQAGERWLVFLSLEERLVFSMVGAMMNVEFKSVDRMVLDAVRLLAQQLMKRLGMYIRMEGQYRLEKDHMITREQLLQEIDVGYPQYSLLLDTGIGYFAFCAKKRSV